MKICSVKAKNYGPFSELKEVKIGDLATIIGKNDVGKSYILKALKLFFDQKSKLDQEDIHHGANQNENVAIEVTFTNLPSIIELEQDVETNFEDELLLDKNKHLRIKKSFNQISLQKYDLSIITNDFVDDNFAGLANLKESELNDRCQSFGIPVSKSGRGKTNKSRREKLREYARNSKITLTSRELRLSSKDELMNKILSMLPDFELFVSDTKLGVDETTFQSVFRPIVKEAAENPDVVESKDKFTGAIGSALQEEVVKIFEYMKQHTDAFNKLTAEPRFAWDKAVTFDILGEDKHGITTSLQQRGSGIRRLLMVSFFQYLAEKQKESDIKTIYAIEEPENCLHPGLQRELIKSFNTLVEKKDTQIIITSHSPVFAGYSPIEDLTLIVRNKGIANALQIPELDLDKIADELGVEPSDQITGYSACVFVEGPDDIMFFTEIATKFKTVGIIDCDFNDKNIGFVPFGGDNFKHWINRRALDRLNRNFLVIVDSDKTSHTCNTPQRKLNWKSKCEKCGGRFFITKKRAIENYIHEEAIKKSTLPFVPYDAFTDMKSLYGDNVSKLIRTMSCEEILEMDCYTNKEGEHHELKEIVEAILTLPDV
jgi:putative ATP-dependent endonuclease of OLD family